MPHSPHEPEFDARTLAEAELIKADPSRSIAAREAASKLAQQQALSAASLANVATTAPIRRQVGEKIAAVLQSGDGRQLPITISRR